MSKNAIKFEDKIAIGNFLKTLGNGHKIGELVELASAHFGRIFSYSQIRKIGKVFGVSIVRGKREKTNFTKGSTEDGFEKYGTRKRIRKSFTCSCGTRYSMHVYKERSAPHA